MKRERLWWGRFGRIQLLLILILLLEIRSGAQALVAIAEGNGPELSGVEESGEIPFTLYDGYLIVVEGRIGAQATSQIVLDTGATHSVLRPDAGQGRKVCAEDGAYRQSRSSGDARVGGGPGFSVGRYEYRSCR